MVPGPAQWGSPVRPIRVLVLFAAAAATGAAALAGCTSGSGSSGASAVAVGAEGNGVETKSATEIVAVSKAAAQAASAVRVAGTADGSQIAARLSPDVADVQLVHSGEHVEVLRVGTDHYLKGDAAFWTEAASAAAAAKLAGKWVKLTAAQAASYEQFLSIPTFFDGMFQSTGTPTKGAVTTVDGTEEVTLVDTDGSKLYVATTGKPYPLKVESAGSTGDQVTLSDWNVPITDIAAPPAGSVVDPSTIAGG